MPASLLLGKADDNKLSGGGSIRTAHRFLVYVCCWFTAKEGWNK